MIILTLIDPKHQTILKEWQFAQESTVQIGRAEDNQVVLSESQLPQDLMAMVSRHHLTLQQISALEWRLTNQGSNGTYLNGVAVQQTVIRSGMQFQLSRGGPIFKVQLQDAAQPAPAQTLQPVAPAPSVAPSLPAPSPAQTPVQTIAFPPVSPASSPASSEAAPSQSLQTQLAAVMQERDRLQNILRAVEAQFPSASLSDRNLAIAQQLQQIQQLQTLWTTEAKHLQERSNPAQSSESLPLPSTDRDRLSQTIADTLNYLEQQQLALQQSSQQVQAALQVLEQLRAHLQANQAIAPHLPAVQPRSQAIAHQIQQALEEFDQELARIQELHATENAKQYFSL